MYKLTFHAEQELNTIDISIMTIIIIGTSLFCLKGLISNYYE